MHKIRKQKADARAAYQRAGECLSQDGARLLLIEAIVCSLLLVGVYVLSFRVAQLIGSVFPSYGMAINSIYYVWIGAMTLFVTLPTVLGLLRMAGRIECGEMPILGDLFYYFSSGVRYRRALNLSFGGFWRMLCVVLAVAATCGATAYFFSGELWAGFLCGVAVLVEIVLWGLLVLRRFAVFAVAFYDEVPLQDARRIAKAMACCVGFGGLRFFFAYLPRILLGILTFGVYLLWDVLPRMGVAYFSYCKQMNDMIIRSEE